MPLTLLITEGVLPKHRHQSTMANLSEAFLRLHGLAGNSAFTPNVIGHITELPADTTFAGLSPAKIAIVEWLTPSFAFATREVQNAYVAEATEILFEACDGRHPRENIWVNLKHAVDGMWGIGGRAYTNQELRAAVAQE